MSKAKNWLRLLESLDIWLLGWDNTNGGRLSASSLSCVCVCVCVKAFTAASGPRKEGEPTMVHPSPRQHRLK